MIEIVALTKELATPLIMEPQNHEYVGNLKKDHIFRDPLARAILINGEAYVIGGCLPLWENRAAVWDVLSEKCRLNFVPIFRAMRDLLHLWLSEYKRLETYVPAHLEFAKRRALMLGFYCETPLAKEFFPSGENASIFVMRRER